MAKVPLDFVVNGRGNAPAFFREVNKGLSGVESSLKTVKTVVGFAGMEEVLSKFAKFTSTAVEMKRAFDEGAVSAGKMTEEVLRMIPGLGKIWQIGRDIRSLLFGPEGAELLAKQQKEQDARIQSMQRFIDVIKQAKQEIAELDAKLNFEKPTSLPAILRRGSNDRGKIEDNETLKRLAQEYAETQKNIAFLEEKAKGEAAYRTMAGVGPGGAPGSVPGEVSAETASRLAFAKGRAKELDDASRALRERLEQTFQRALEFEIVKSGGEPIARAIQDAFSGMVGRSLRSMAEAQAGQKGLKDIGKAFMASLGVPGDLLGRAAGAGGDWLSGLAPYMQWNRAPAQFSGGLAATEQSRFLTGVAAAGRENDPAVKTEKNTAQTNKLLGDMIHFWQQNWAKFGGAPAPKVYNG